MCLLLLARVVSCSGGKYGSIYYCEVGSRKLTPARSLPLAQITDIFSGRHGLIWTKGDALFADEDRCLTFLCKEDSKSLYLEAMNEQMSHDFLEGVRHVFSSAGTPLEEEVFEEKGVHSLTNLLFCL